MFGALAYLFMIGDPLSTTSQIGIFMLVGIIVNNGIVLVDYMHLYSKGTEYDMLNKNSVRWQNLFIPVFFWKEKPTVKDSELLKQITEACRRRMRPILLTAITTICSMIPLSLELGSGAETWSPLAKAVIGGLLFGSILTLFITPVISVSLSMTIEWFKELFRSNKETATV
jgi:HAE1 family hydrophobic/amphiphilic exporter-1